MMRVFHSPVLILHCIVPFHLWYSVSYLSCCLTTNSMFFLSAAVFKLCSKDSYNSQCPWVCESGGSGLSARKRLTWSTEQIIMHGGIWGGFVSVMTSICFRMLYRAWELPWPIRWWRKEVIIYFSYILRKSDVMLFTFFSVHEPWLCHYFYFI
jgi:hypothetical protein